MIANYTDHAANERTFLAWIRTGLAVIAFGFFLFKLDVLVDAVGSRRFPHLPVEGIVAVVARDAGLALVAVGIVVIARSGVGFERTRRAINCDEMIQIGQSRAGWLLSAALTAATTISLIYLAG